MVGCPLVSCCHTFPSRSTKSSYIPPDGFIWAMFRLGYIKVQESWLQEQMKNSNKIMSSQGCIRLKTDAINKTTLGFYTCVWTVEREKVKGGRQRGT